MPVGRGSNTKPIPLKIVGSSVYGVYPKISTERTINMYVTDDALTNLPGYKQAINYSEFNNAAEGRALYESPKLSMIFAVFDNNVYSISIKYDHITQTVVTYSVSRIGQLATATGVVYISENNKPQVLFSDNVNLYIYDELLTPTFQQVTGLEFTPGYITFHDTYFICAASNDTYYTPAANNTWRLSLQNDGTMWPAQQDGTSYIGILETKPDNTQAVVRFPSRGNMIFVFGKTVTESWFDTGAQLFPYQRQDQYNIDYGCLNPASVAFMDEIVVWVARNEKSGPVIMYSTGGLPTKVTTDGIDYQLSEINTPQDCQGFIYRKNGHIFYVLNFYSDNISFVVDFTNNKIYNACDENLNYFAMGQVVWFDNQYYAISKNDGNLYVFDTTINTYDYVDGSGVTQTTEIPRIRTCQNLRLPTQDYCIVNDIGFTIETGENNYQFQDYGPLYLITEDGNRLITDDDTTGMFTTEDGFYLTTEDGDFLVSETPVESTNYFLISEQNDIRASVPCVDLTMSYDGSATFGNAYRYVLNPIGQRKNKLQWWQIGMGNDMVPQFKFWGIGRVVAKDGIANLRQ